MLYEQHISFPPAHAYCPRPLEVTISVNARESDLVFGVYAMSTIFPEGPVPYISPGVLEEPATVGCLFAVQKGWEASEARLRIHL